MKRGGILSLLICVGFYVCLAQPPHNATDTFSVAAKSNKPVFLLFAGSDWCVPCIQFERKVMEQDAFQSYAKENLIVLVADFPQHKKISAEEKKQNNALAEKFNPTGIFPYFLLLNADQTVIGILSYSNQNSQEFVTLIQRTLQK